jgi:hypothetical protein
VCLCVFVCVFVFVRVGVCVCVFVSVFQLDCLRKSLFIYIPINFQALNQHSHCLCDKLFKFTMNKFLNILLYTRRPTMFVSETYLRRASPSRNIT